MSKETLYAIIENQQKGHETETVYMIGEQIKEIAHREPANIELLEHDLATDGMKLTDLADHFQKYADKNRGSQKSFCITPKVAEKLIREFFGLPDESANIPKETTSNETFIDLSAFL